MALKRNVFSEALVTCLKEVADCNFVSSIADGNTSSGPSCNRIVFAALVSTRFLSDSRRPRHYGGHQLEGEEVKAIIDEANRRFQAHCLCLAFEAVERFFKELGGDSIGKSESRFSMMIGVPFSSHAARNRRKRAPVLIMLNSCVGSTTEILMAC